MDNLNKTIKDIEKQIAQKQKEHYEEINELRDRVASLYEQVIQKRREEDSKKFIEEKGCHYDKPYYYPIFLTFTVANAATARIYKAKLAKYASEIEGDNQSGKSGFGDKDTELTFLWIFKKKKAREEFILYVFNTFGGGHFSCSDLSDVEIMGS